jgi:Transposase IS116/IS110/IS902 family/Uncharacterized protein conserved in bacteria (DUF2252)
MAEDVARLPSTGITPVVRGDSHLGNFGFYASPGRDLVHRLRNEASLAALCGVAPVPASSGKITPHRLSRGGDRAANNALHRRLLRPAASPTSQRHHPGQPSPLISASH